jgi:HK97 family phage prohead protease
MAKLTKLRTGAILKASGLGDRQIRVIASDATVDLAGDVMEPMGCDIEGYKKNPIVLAGHDSMKPIGRAAVTVRTDRVEALIDFAPEGASVLADEWCGLAKAGVLNAVSIGFDPIESKPNGSGLRYTKWRLLELSVCTVPANPSALVIERSAKNRASNVADTVAFAGIIDRAPIDVRDFFRRMARWPQMTPERLSNHLGVALRLRSVPGEELVRRRNVREVERRAREAQSLQSARDRAADLQRLARAGFVTKALADGKTMADLVREGLVDPPAPWAVGAGGEPVKDPRESLHDFQYRTRYFHKGWTWPQPQF